MGSPNHIQQPDGRTVISTKDQAAHSDQGPETRTSAHAAADATTHAHKDGEAQQEEHALWQRAIDAEANHFTHYCVGGKVARNCEKCGASHAAGYV